MNPHIRELAQALIDSAPEDNLRISDDLRHLLEAHLLPGDLPDTLSSIGPAEAFHAAFNAMGGLPRLLLYADRYPAGFYKLYARLLVLTAHPIVPAPSSHEATQDEWPSWMQPRRLSYQAPDYARGGASDPHAPTSADPMDDTDPDHA